MSFINQDDRLIDIYAKEPSKMPRLPRKLDSCMRSGEDDVRA